MSIIVLAGASGSGKTSFMREFLKAVQGSTLLMSTTTRARREDDIHLGDAHEYEYKSREQFKVLEQEGVFLDTFGEEYLTQYGTRARLFEEALQSTRIYIAALFLPGIELFFDEAYDRNKQDSLHALFLDLDSEEERLRRLTRAGNRDAIRFEPELEKWRRGVEIEYRELPFFKLNATHHSPQELVQKTLEKFTMLQEA